MEKETAGGQRLHKLPLWTTASICCFAQHHRLDFSILVFWHAIAFYISCRQLHDSALCHVCLFNLSALLVWLFTPRTITMQ